jgi:queuine tRNA-ribosyltransferase catalytic subunit
MVVGNRLHESNSITADSSPECCAADAQNLFPIVQGGLDDTLGGLREQCLAGFRHRQVHLGYRIPGYAIGGLAGGEAKDDFWKIVDLCCRALPDDKPRYLMG